MADELKPWEKAAQALGKLEPKPWEVAASKKKASDKGGVNTSEPLDSGFTNFQPSQVGTTKPAIPTVLTGEARKQAQEKFDQNKERVAKSQPVAKKKPDGGSGTSFMKGLTSFNESIYKLPQFLYEASTVIPNAIADLTNSPEIQALDYDTLINATGSQSPLSILRNLGRTEEIKAGIYDKQKEKFDKGVFDSIKDGKYGDAGKQVLNNFAESIPSMAGMMMTGAAGSTVNLGKLGSTIAKTLPFASAKNTELRENKDIPDYIKPINAAFNGLSEVIYDQEFGTSAILKDVIQSFTNEGKEMAAKKAKDFVTGYITNAVKKFQPLTSGVKNSIEEMATQYSQNMVDKLTVNPDKDLLEGLPDAAIVGGVTGTAVQSVGTINGLLSSKKKQKLNEVAKRRSEIVSDLDNPNLPDDIKGDLLDQLERENDKIAKISDDAEAVISSLPEQEQKEALQAQEKIEVLEQSLNAEGVSDGTKQRLQEQIEKEQDKLDVLVGTAEILNKPVEEVKAEPVVEEDKAEPKIQSWIDKWNELKTEDNPENLENFYSKVRVALNGYAQGKGEDVVAEFESLKKDIEQYAIERKGQSNEQLSTTINNEQPTTNEQETITEETQAEVNQDNRPEPVTGSVESGEVTPEAVDFAIQEIQKGAINWDGDRFTPRPVLGMEWKDIRKGSKDIQDGKMTAPAIKLINAINKAKEEGGYKFTQGSGKIKTDTFVPISDIYDTELTAEELEEITANEAQLAQEYDEWFDSLSEEEQLEELNFTEDGKETSTDTQAESQKDVSDQEDTEPTAETEPEGTALKNADNAEKRAEIGLEPLEPANYKSNEKLVEDAKSKIREGYNTPDLIDNILNKKHEASDEEVIILKQYQLAKESELLDLNDKIVSAIKDGNNTESSTLISKRDIVLEEINNAHLAGKKTGERSARALQARAVDMLQDYSLANMLINARESIGGQKMSTDQYNDIVRRYEEIKSLNEQLEADKARLQKELLDTLAEKSYKKAVNQAKFEQRKTGRVVEREAIQKDISSTLESLKKKLKKERSQLNSGISPDMIPEIAKLAQLYAKLGINTVEEVVDKIYTDLKDEIDGLNTEDIKAVLANYDYEAQAKEEARLKGFKTRSEAKINELRDRINRGDFAKRKIAPIKLDEKALELRDALMKAKFDYEVALLKNELAQRNNLQKANDLLVDISGVFRAMQATLDLSAVFRQGFVKTVGGLVSRRPDKVPRMILEMLKQTVDEKRYNRWLYDLQENPYYEVIKDSKLYISDVKNPKITAREEALQSNLVNKIPILNIFTRGSERAYSSFLNMQRVDTFLKAARAMEIQGKTIETHPQDYKELANYVNTATGRGDLGAIENWSDFLSSTMFSPRFLASRVRLLTNLINPFWWKDTPMNVKVMYVKDVVKIAAAVSAIVGLAQLAGYDVEEDPRSSDFMKIRIGDTRIDLLAGLGQFFVFAVRFVTGETKDKYGQVKDVNRGDVFKRFIRSKLAPIWGISTSLATGKDYLGNDYDLSNVPREFIPLSLRDVFSNWGNDEELLRTLKFLPLTIFGVGVATYKNKSDVNTPDKTIRLNDEVTFKLTKDQLEEREAFNDEYLKEHEEELRESYKKFNEQHPNDQLKPYEIENKIKIKANKYSRGQMLKKYRNPSGKGYNLTIKND